MTELLLDVLEGLGPHAVAVRIVGAPHQSLHPHVLDELGADAVELKGRLALPPPVVARLHAEPEIPEPVLPLEVHAIQRVRNPADAALPEGDAEVGVALEHGAADHRGQDVDQVHLEPRHAGEHGGALGVAGRPLAHGRRHGGKGMEVQRQVDLVHRLPERLPRGMPHGVHVPGAGELESSEPHLGHAVDLLHRRSDVPVGQAGEADLPVGIVAAEVHQPVVVDAEHLARRLVIVQPRGRAQDAEDDLRLDTITIHVLDAQLGGGGTRDALLAVLVEPGRGHHVRSIVHPGNVFLSRWPHAAPQSERGAVLRRPRRAVRPVRDVGHAVAKRRARVFREEIGGHPGHVDVAVGRDPREGHGVLLLGEREPIISDPVLLRCQVLLPGVMVWPLLKGGPFMAMKTVVALPGEGIGLEVVDATCELLMSTGLPLKILTPPQGSPLPEETKQAAREADGVLFGAAGPSTSAVVSWLRWEMSAWAGVRPIRFFPGMRSPLADPDGIDYILLRENSEGLYPGREGDLADLVNVLPDLSDKTGRKVKDFGDEGRFAVKIVTPKGAERIARFACDLAIKRKARGKPGKVTCITKSNVLPRTDGLYQQTAERIVREAGLAFEHFHVDDGARRLVRFPKSMDVVLCMNLYGDILSDLGAETAGGLGLAPSGNFGDNGWAYFESVHGSAPDIAGKGIANPTATILSAALMLEHMGMSAEALRLQDAVGRIYRDGKILTPDQGGSAKTREMAQAVLAAYR